MQQPSPDEGPPAERASNRHVLGPVRTGRPAEDRGTDPAPDRVLMRLGDPRLRLAVLGVVLAVALALTVRDGGVRVESLREVFDGLGLIGPLVFVLVYAVAATAMLPAAPFTISAGLIFGPFLGTATALVGASLGATGGFLVGRTLGRGAVERFGGRRSQALDRFLVRRGFTSLLLVRLVPLFPFNLVNLVAGVTGMRLRDYVSATVIGILPGTVAYAALGGTIDDPRSSAFVGALVVFVLVTAAAGFAARRLRSQGRFAERSD